MKNASLRNWNWLNCGWRHLLLGFVAQLLVVTSTRALEENADGLIVLSGTLENSFVMRSGEVRSGGRSINWGVRIGRNNSWSINATNAAHDPLHAVEAGLTTSAVSDGTNIFIIEPSVLYEDGVIRANPELNLASVSNDSLPMFISADQCHLGDLWIAFCSKAAFDKASPDGSPVNWPILEGVPRVSPGAWLFQWEFPEVVNGRFANGVVAKMIDPIPKFEEVLMLPNLVHPTTKRQMEDYRQGYNNTPWGYSDGKLRFKYEVLEWRLVDGVNIPRKAVLSYFTRTPAGRPQSSHSRTTIEVTRAAFERTGPLTIKAPTVAIRTGVDDYRFGRKNEKKQMISLNYRLQEGDSWKIPEDPVAIALADRRWKYEKPYFPIFTLRRLLLLVAFVILIVPFALFVRKVGRHQASRSKGNDHG